MTCNNPDRVLGSVYLCKSGITTFFAFQASAHNPGDNQCRSTHPGTTNYLSNWRRFTTLNCLYSLIVHLYFVEKTLQQDMLDFLQGARGQEFHDITLIVDGEPVGAHKVRFVRIFVWELIVCEISRELGGGGVGDDNGCEENWPAKMWGRVRITITHVKPY